MYKKNDYVVYKHDVCKIKDIKENKLIGKTYYVMNPIDDDTLTIDIPVDNKNELLRNIISSTEAEELIKKIPFIQPIEVFDEKNIEAQYKKMLSSGDHESLIKIIKTTYLRNENRINNKKKISEKDNTYFKLAEKYLYNELAISLNKSVDDIKEYIYEIVNQ